MAGALQRASNFLTSVSRLLPLTLPELRTLHLCMNTIRTMDGLAPQVKLTCLLLAKNGVESLAHVPDTAAGAGPVSKPHHTVGS